MCNLWKNVEGLASSLDRSLGLAVNVFPFYFSTLNTAHFVKFLYMLFKT